MYTEYWGFKEKPFENTADPRFLYHSQQHDEAFSRLLYAIREKKAAAMLTGEFGSGKTLLSRVLMEELSKERYKVTLIFNPKLNPLEFLQEIAFQLGEEPGVPNTKREVLTLLNTIFTNNFRHFKDTVLVIDEAQAIEDNEIFEELRLLLNFQLESAFLITLVLLGQPELIRKVSSIPQLDQRIAIRYHLWNLTEEETRGYILHRLSMVATHKDRTVFTDEAIKLIFQASGGTPRLINNICDMCLLVGFGSMVEIIEAKTVMEVVRDLEERYASPKKG